MRQKTTITYLEHNMLACNRINRAIASWKKHVRVFSETCTSFSENTYMFFRKDVGVSSASLKAYNKCMLVSLLASFFAVSTVNAQVNERGDSVIVIKGHPLPCRNSHQRRTDRNCRWPCHRRLLLW